MAATRIIKKYPNRRLYDTEISSYITIEDVRQLIVDGEDFEVRDAKTGDDLTRTVLLQIISEQEQDGEPILSTQLLSHIIRFYGDSMQGFMGNYLERSMQLFMAAAVPPADGRHAGANAVDHDEPADRTQPGAVAGVSAQLERRRPEPAGSEAADRAASRYAQDPHALNRHPLGPRGNARAQRVRHRVSAAPFHRDRRPRSHP